MDYTTDSTDSKVCRDSTDSSVICLGTMYAEPRCSYLFRKNVSTPTLT
jgi:hypothetical protein